MTLSMSVSLSHWNHSVWERTVSAWNSEFLASPKALWTKGFLRPFINGQNDESIVESELGHVDRFKS
ncbi:hypothetical protein TNCV_4763501 [Trichonephila clavipes]|nr:hypothetical protein TNCV_4763501 [Trichonephila clavipes]